MDTFFPKLNESVLEKEYLSRLKNRSLLLLDEIIRDNDNKIEIEKIDDFIFSQYSPKVFGGSEGLEVNSKNIFEDTCSILESKGYSNPKKLTYYQFLRKLEFIKSQIPKNKKRLRK